MGVQEGSWPVRDISTLEKGERATLDLEYVLKPVVSCLSLKIVIKQNFEMLQKVLRQMWQRSTQNLSKYIVEL